MARLENDIPIREHMRRRGVEATITDDEGTESTPDSETEEGEVDPRLGQKRKRGGRLTTGKGNWEKWTKFGLKKGMKNAGVEDESGPVDEGAPAGEPEDFQSMLLNNTDIPHELKAQIMEKYNMANPSNADSIGGLHRAIYGSGLPGELKDKLANLRTYGDSINVNKNSARQGPIDVGSTGPTASVNPSTGQPWDKKIGPTMRQKLLDQDAAAKAEKPPVEQAPESAEKMSAQGAVAPGGQNYNSYGANPRPAPQGQGNWWDILYGGNGGPRPIPAPRPGVNGGPPQAGPSQQPNPYQLLLMQMLQQGGR